MFDIGFWELALAGVVALIVIGPEKLPEVARNVGAWIGRMRAMVNHVRREFEQELKVGDLKRTFEESARNEEIKRLAEQVKSINRDLHQPVTPAPPSPAPHLVSPPSHGPKSADAEDSPPAPNASLASETGDTSKAPSSPTTCESASSSDKTHS